MKKFFAFFFLLFSPLFSQNEFVRGLYMFQYTAADFQRLRDSLHLNWVQAAVDKWNGSQYVWDNSVLQNNGQLKIAAIIDSTVNTMSAGQHMEFEAEEGSSDPLKSYFGARTGLQDNTLWMIRTGYESPGYMVQDAVPDNEYRYGQTHYIASFIMKRANPPSGDPLVARLEVWCKYSNTLLAYRDLRAVSDFSSSNLETKTLEFDITYSPDPLPTPLLRGVLMARTAQPALLTCDGIDIRVYWYGNLTTWLDKVIVEDALGRQLFSGAYDASLNSTIQQVSAHPLVKRLYMRDEPEISSFLSFKYIQEKARLIYGTPSDGTGSGITATNRPWSFERFLVDAQPHELFVNAYPIDADVPIPPSAMSAAEATSVGIAAYSSDEDYTQFLQSSVQTWYLDYSIKPAANLAKLYGKTLWIIPQLHGEYFELSGKFRYPVLGNRYDDWAKLRPPTGNEVKMLCNLGVAYGAKGLVPFIHNTPRIEWKDATINEGWSDFPGLVSSVPDADSIFRNHWSNYGVFNCPGGQKTIWVGYKEKWDALATVNQRLAQLEPTLAGLTWQGVKSWGFDTTGGSWSGKITSVTSNVPGEPKYVETAHFTGSAIDYFYVVNRRTLESQARILTLTLNNNSPWEVTDVASGKIWVIGPNGTFSDTLSAGEGNLYRAGPMSYNWSGIRTITGNITVPDGTTLTVSAGSVMKIENNGSILINGGINVNGSSVQHVTIDGLNQSRLWWYYPLIKFGEGGGGTISYTDVKRAAYLLLVLGNNDPLTIQNSTFSDWGLIPESSYAVDVENTTSAVTIQNSVFSGGVGGSGTSGYAIRCANTTPTITISGNTITDCRYGVYLTSSQALLQNNTIEDCSVSGVSSTFATMSSQYLDNHVHYCTVGFGLISSTPLMQGNRISYNTVQGMLLSESSPQFGLDYMDDPGYNVFRGNGSAGIEADNNCYPFMGYNAFPEIWAGYNSIYDTQNGPGVKFTNNCFAYAQVNYWGNSWFDIDGSSYFDPDFPQPDDPNNGEYWKSLDSSMSISEDIQLPQAPSKSNASFGEFAAIWELICSSKYEDARIAASEYIEKNPESRNARVALHFYENTLERQVVNATARSVETTLRSTARDFFSSIATDSTKISLQPMALRLLSREYSLAGKMAEKLALNDRIMTAFPTTPEAKAAAFDNLEYHLVQKREPEVARPYYDFIATRDPASKLLNGVSELLQRPTAPLRIAVDKPKATEPLRVEYALDEPFPNPFNPSTEIRFKLKNSAIVQLIIYDMLGRVVEVLQNGRMSQGLHTLNWNAIRHPSGMYICRFTAVDEVGSVFTAASRMTLIK